MSPNIESELGAPPTFFFLFQLLWILSILILLGIHLVLLKKCRPYLKEGSETRALILWALLVLIPILGPVLFLQVIHTRKQSE
ncbi:MAG: hypothetical protein H8E27_02855 [Verrucomicrobia subdivision 3 bacterium]|nr:hypothetical protein [Limisphaerales bacterium]